MCESSGRNRLMPSGKETLYGTLRLPRTLENPPIERIKLVNRREEPETGFLANDDSRRFRTDFDDVSV